MRNVSDKSCRENQNTHCMFSNIFPKIMPFPNLPSWCGQGQLQPVALPSNYTGEVVGKKVLVSVEVEN